MIYLLGNDLDDLLVQCGFSLCAAQQTAFGDRWVH